MRNIEDFGPCRGIGLRDHRKWSIGERVIRGRARLFANRHHWPADREAHDIFEGDHPAVDDRQAGRYAGGFDLVAVVAAEARAARVIECEAAVMQSSA